MAERICVIRFIPSNTYHVLLSFQWHSCGFFEKPIIFFLFLALDFPNDKKEEAISSSRFPPPDISQNFLTLPTFCGRPQPSRPLPSTFYRLCNIAKQDMCL